jgi:uncharacterized protein YbjQ (UPF0145 family)
VTNVGHVADWDGRGLPPVAAERVRRAAAGGAWTSLLSVPAAAGLEVAGFDPVGEVMGSMVQRIGWSSYFGCGATGWSGAGSRTITSGTSPRAGFAPYAHALESGWATAVGRMVIEAATIGADGIVGVRLSQQSVGNAVREFTAMGTAVRARSTTRPGRVFSTHLPGQDVAKLVLAGWMPAELALGIAVGIRHDDWNTRQQRTWTAGNVEISAYTELVNQTRADARMLLQRRIQAVGADGAVVATMGLSTWEIEPGEGHTDHIAEATIIATAITQFHRSRVAPSRSLTYLPLKRSRP